MAHKKAGGSTKNLRDSGPQYLGIKLNHGEKAMTGQVIVRQRGTAIMAGKNVAVAKDHTLFAMKDGTVAFKNKRKSNFDGSISTRKSVDVQ